MFRDCQKGQNLWHTFSGLKLLNNKHSCGKPFYGTLLQKKAFCRSLGNGESAGGWTDACWDKKPATFFALKLSSVPVACHLAVLEGHLFAGRQQMMWKSGTCRLLSELLHLPVLVRPLFAKAKCPYLQNSVINVVEVGALNWVLFEVSQRASALLQQWQENNDSKILRGVSSPEGGNTDWPVSLCRKITDSFAFSF